MLKPISHRDFVKKLKALGFTGPFSGGKHPFMIKGTLTLTIPNPHSGDIGVPLLKRILKQGKITAKEWNEA